MTRHWRGAEPPWFQATAPLPPQYVGNTSISAAGARRFLLLGPRRGHGALPPWPQAPENTNGYYVRQTYSKWLRSARQWQRRGRCINPWPALTPYSQEVLKDGPIRYWKLAEASGTVAIDSSGYGRSGTYVSGPFLGQPGPATTDNDTAAGFQKGFDQYATVPWPQLTQITFEAWTYRPSTASDFFDNVVLSDPVGANGAGLVFFQDAIAGQAVDGSSVQQFAQDPNTLVPGDWHHIVFTYEGTTMLLYVDGVQVASQAATGLTIGTGTGTIGRYAAFIVTAGTFNGNLAQIAIYNKVLSAARVLVHYNTMAPVRITTRVPTFATASQRPSRRTHPQPPKGRSWSVAWFQTYLGANQPYFTHYSGNKYARYKAGLWQKRGHLWVPISEQQNPAFTRGQRRTALTQRSRLGRTWVIPDSNDASQQKSQRRTALNTALRLRQRAASFVVPTQVALPNPAIVFGWGQRRVKPPYAFRSRHWFANWPATVAPLPPTLVFGWGQRRTQPPYARRGHIWAPIPPQAAAWTNQPYFTFYRSHVILRHNLQWQRRGHLWLPIPEQQYPPLLTTPAGKQVRNESAAWQRRGHLWLPAPVVISYGPNPLLTEWRNRRNYRRWFEYYKRGHTPSPPWFQAYGPNPPTVMGGLRTRGPGKLWWIGPRRGKLALPGWGQAIVLVQTTAGLYLPSEYVTADYIATEEPIAVWNTSEGTVSFYNADEVQM